MRLRTPIAPLPDGRYRLRLDAGERRLVRGLCEELGELIRADDAGVARLFPPGSRDDEEAAKEFAKLVHPGLREQRLASLDVVARSLDSDTLSQEEAEAWCGALNDLRLVLGERLGVTEDLDLGALALLRHPQARELALYGWLTAVQSAAVEALASRL
jgi:hypothetical protein